MRFSIRRSVYFDDFDKWLSKLEGIPIELALPAPHACDSLSRYRALGANHSEV